MRKIDLREYATNILILFVAIFISMLMIEGALRLFYPQEVHCLGLNPIYRWGGLPNVEGIYTVEGDGNIYYSKMNSKGLRDVEHSYENTGGKYRILFLGDSYTYGYAVNTSDAYPRVLEGMLNSLGDREHEVINGGISGWGTDTALAWLMYEGIKYEPDMVVLGFLTHNDPTDNMREEIYYVEEGKLTRNYHPTNYSLRMQLSNFINSNSHLYRLVKSRLYDPMFAEDQSERWDELRSYYARTVSGIYNSKVDEGWNKTFLILDEMKEFLDQHETRLVIVSLSSSWQVYDDRLEEVLDSFGIEDEANINRSIDILADYCEARGIRHISTLDDFRKESSAGAELFYEHDTHPNRDGQRLIAEIVFRELASDGFGTGS